MTTRVEGGLTYTQTFRQAQCDAFDAENRLISVTVSGQTTQFSYDGDGNLVKKTKPDGSRTIYVGGLYEVNKNAAGTVTGTTTYYPAGGAMRVNGTLYFVLKDKLGSASVVTDASGNTVGEARYYPYGETRLTTGTMNTDKLFTGQREITGLGIYHYGSRFYSPKLGRFLSADTMVPNPFNPQAFNRYSYVYNNPLRYVDPSGHTPVCGFSYSDPECYEPDRWTPSQRLPPPPPPPPLDPGRTQNPPRPGGAGSSTPSLPVVPLASDPTSGSGGTNDDECDYGHCYEQVSVVCPAIYECTEDDMKIYATMFQYPGQNPLFPVENRHTYFVFPAPQLALYLRNPALIWTGAIRTTISQDGLTLTNQSLPTHIFHDGTVVRSYTQREDGAWIVTTTGAGTNVWPLIGPTVDLANDVVGAPTFAIVDAQMRAYITADQTTLGWLLPP
jgi:RHS repeat-associated protein